MENMTFLSTAEALSRLDQTRDRGVLFVSKGFELVQIYVQECFVIRASSRAKDGLDAIDLAMHLTGATYTWLRGVQPPLIGKNLHISIREIVGKPGDAPKAKMIETSRLTGTAAKESEAVFKYYLVPHDKPTTKVYLTKSSTVLGRDTTADVVIDNMDVSSRHCLLDMQTRGLSVLDLKSTNGTYVNGTLVRDSNLNHGDVLELGQCRFTVNRESINTP